MILREELKQLKRNAKLDAGQIYEKVKEHPLIYLIFIVAVITAMLSLIVLPYMQVNYHGINNATEIATLENQYRATLAQIIGGGAVLLGLYFAWGNLITAREGQITERFTRAVDQLGNKNMEIRLGGIYALERIANESDKDYWQILEILTGHIREKLFIESEDIKKQNKVSLDTQAILTVIGRRKYFFNFGESNCLDLHETYLHGANLKKAHLEKVNLRRANLKKANLERAYLQGADLMVAKLGFADLEKADLGGANLFAADLTNANLKGANLQRADLEEADLEGADLEGANLEEADLEGAHLKGVNSSPELPNLTPSCNVSFDQLSKVKTLYSADLDEELEMQLRDKYPHLFYPTAKHPEEYF